MRILYLSNSYTVHDRRFLDVLSGSSHESWFLPLDQDRDSWFSTELPSDINLVPWPSDQVKPAEPEGILEFVPDYLEIVNRIQPQVIHAGPVYSMGFLTALIDFHPSMVMSWGSDLLLDASSSRMMEWMSRVALEHADTFVCDSDAVRLKALELAPAGFDDMVQFPWGVDLDRFGSESVSRDIRKDLGWEDCVVIFSSRSWEPLYGLDTVVEAFRIASSGNPLLRMILAGDGTLRPDIERSIRQTGISELIHCPGMIPQAELADYYQSSDSYLSCSRSDGASISLLEAMASRLPVIVTDIASNREWVESGRNGWLVTSGDENAFADAILEAARADTRRLTEIGMRNRTVVESRADWRINAGKLLEAYERFE